MWGLFENTGNLDAYLAYRACVIPDIDDNGVAEAAYYGENFSNKATLTDDA
jgi:hypothetical protein